MYRWLVALSIIVLLIPVSVVYGIKTGEIEIGNSGIYDGEVKISRDAEGNLVVSHGALDHFVISHDGSATAGVADNVSIAARITGTIQKSRNNLLA